MKKTPVIAFLGAGNMGGALIQGAVKAGSVRAKDVAVYDVDKAKVSVLARKTGVRKASSNADAVKGAEYVFLCVKPQQMAELLVEIKPAVSPKQCLVSIAAGVKAGKIEGALGAQVPVVRVMPNTPALVSAGMSAAAAGRYAKPAHLKFVVQFLKAVGKAVVLPEDLMDAVTAVSGSGPAYVFYLAETLERAAQSAGLPQAEARLLARETVMGAAKLLNQDVEPAELRRRVTSPGGTTEAAIKHMADHQWAEIFVEAVRKARDRSIELSK